MKTVGIKLNNWSFKQHEIFFHDAFEVETGDWEKKTKTMMAIGKYFTNPILEVFFPEVHPADLQKLPFLFAAQMLLYKIAIFLQKEI